MSTGKYMSPGSETEKKVRFSFMLSCCEPGPMKLGANASQVRARITLDSSGVYTFDQSASKVESQSAFTLFRRGQRLPQTKAVLWSISWPSTLLKHPLDARARSHGLMLLPAILVPLLLAFPALYFVRHSFSKLHRRWSSGRRRIAMSTSTEAPQDLKVVEFDRTKFCEQPQSPLFSVLPGEIRDRIFTYALAEFEDTSEVFDSNTCYRRPEYAAPRRSDTALLRTCQRIYQEALFYPFALAEQILWLTGAGRRPREVTTIERLKPSLELMHKLHGDVELQSVRVFAQLYALESGSQLGKILELPHFLPRTMTVTLRHTDIWYWETDEPIRIDGPWTSVCRFPNSLRCINVQIESLERKKDQVDYVVAQAIQNWHFKRQDETILSATNKSTSVTRWSGSSTWEKERWLRDESRPETIDYYVVTIAFRPVPPGEAKPLDENRILQLGPMPCASPMQYGRPSVYTSELLERGVPPGCSADEVMARFDQHRRDQAALATQRRGEELERRRQRQAQVAQGLEFRRRVASEARAQRLARNPAPDVPATPALPAVGPCNLRAGRRALRALRNAAADGDPVVGGLSRLG